MFINEVSKNDIYKWRWIIHKYSEKYKDLSEEDQKALQKKTKTSEVEVIIDGNKKTLVQPQQIVSYNIDMRTPNFEKQMLDFQKQMLDFQEQMLDFQKQMLDFVKEQKEFNKMVIKRLDAIEDKLERNNIK